MKRLGAIAICLLALTTMAAAEEGRPRSNDRYMVSEVPEGLLRVDRYTGEVSLCTGGRRGWSCELVPDDRDALEHELQAVRRDNRQLRRRLGGGDSLDGHGRYGRREPIDPLDEPGGIMTPQEVDEAMDTLEYMMGRFMGTAERLRKRYETPK